MKDFRILIDGDSCPVRSQIIELARRYELHVILVQSMEHNVREPLPDFVEFYRVDNISQAADIKIANLIRKDDILVTGDFGLAALALGKKARVISPSGRNYENENMDYMLFERHISQKVRQRGNRTKGPKPRNSGDDENFVLGLMALIEKEIP